MKSHEEKPRIKVAATSRPKVRKNEEIIVDSTVTSDDHNSPLSSGRYSPGK